MRVVKNNTLFYGSLLLIQCLFWGMGNPIIKIMLEDITLFYSLTIRFVIASALFLIFLRNQLARKMRREYIVPCLVVSFFTALVFATSNLALMYTQSTIAGFLMGLAIIFTQPMARLFLGIRMNPIQYIPMTMVVVGMYYLCGASGEFTFGLGEFFAIFCSFCAACMLVASSKYLTTDIDPFIFSIMQTVMMTFYFLAAALIFETPPALFAIPGSVWLATMYLAVTCTCMAYIIQNTALAKVPPSYAALIFCSEPIFTAVTSYFLLGETLGRAGLFGAALIMASIIFASVIPQDNAYRPAPLRIARVGTKKALRYIRKNSKRR